MNQYKLSDLPYDYGALEPHVSGKIMELHHDKHHAGYVNGANTTLERLDEARAKEQFDRIPALERSLAFNLSGHILHSIFWRNLSPRGGGEPAGELKAALERDFGGFPAFRRQLNEVAASIMGSGWAALIWEPLGARLLITQIYDHQSNLNQSAVPLLVLDAWEHAYYLQYENRGARGRRLSACSAGVPIRSRDPPHKTESVLDLGHATEPTGPGRDGIASRIPWTVSSAVCAVGTGASATPWATAPQLVPAAMALVDEPIPRPHSTTSPSRSRRITARRSRLPRDQRARPLQKVCNSRWK